MKKGVKDRITLSVFGGGYQADIFHDVV